MNYLCDLLLILILIIVLMAILYKLINNLYKINQYDGGNKESLFEQKVRTIFNKIIKYYPIPTDKTETIYYKENNSILVNSPLKDGYGKIIFNRPDFKELKSDADLKSKINKYNMHNINNISYLNYIYGNEKRYVDFDGFINGCGLPGYPNIAFEAQGPYHYIESAYNNHQNMKNTKHTQYTKRRCSDLLKKTICKNHNIIFFEIPYIEVSEFTPEKLESYILLLVLEKENEHNKLLFRDNNMRNKAQDIQNNPGLYGIVNHYLTLDSINYNDCKLFDNPELNLYIKENLNILATTHTSQQLHIFRDINGIILNDIHNIKNYNDRLKKIRDYDQESNIERLKKIKEFNQSLYNQYPYNQYPYNQYPYNQYPYNRGNKRSRDVIDAIYDR